jgi:hypothetical protein
MKVYYINNSSTDINFDKLEPKQFHYLISHPTFNNGFDLELDINLWSHTLLSANSNTVVVLF